MGAFKFKKKTEYGLLMVSILARNYGSCVSAMQMAAEGLPQHFVAKIARDLIEVGILGSKEGRGGGYFLKKKLEEVTVKEVVEVLEGPVEMPKCMSCPFSSICQHDVFLDELIEEIEEVLQKYTLADLV